MVTGVKQKNGSKIKVGDKVSPASFGLFPAVTGMFARTLSVDDIGTVKAITRSRGANRYQVEWEKDNSIRYADEDMLRKLNQNPTSNRYLHFSNERLVKEINRLEEAKKENKGSEAHKELVKSRLRDALAEWNSRRHKNPKIGVMENGARKRKYRVTIKVGSRNLVDTVVEASNSTEARDKVKRKYNIPASASCTVTLAHKQNPTKRKPERWELLHELEQLQGERQSLIDKYRQVTHTWRKTEIAKDIQANAKEIAGVQKQLGKRNGPVQDFKQFQKQRVNENSLMFQGEATGKRQRVLESDLAPKGAKSRLGELVLMKVKLNGSKQVIDITFDKDAWLSMDIRKNLHAVGKGAIIENPQGLGIKKQRNGIAVIGDLIQIDYVTAKKHIENGERVRFWHPLGEIDKDYPKLGLDADNFPVIIGGGYDVWDVGIVN